MGKNKSQHRKVTQTQIIDTLFNSCFFLMIQLTRQKYEHFQKLKMSQNWNLSNGREKYDEVRHLLTSSQQNNVKILNLSANNWENILISISTIKFTFLANLDISGNNISSISTLCELDATHLTWLNISWNNISNLRNLKKCNFSKLQVLILAPISEDIASWHLPKLRELRLQSAPNYQQICPMIELWCLRSQPKQLIYLVCQSSKRMQKPFISKALRQKYSYLKMFTSNTKKPTR